MLAHLTSHASMTDNYFPSSSREVQRRRRRRSIGSATRSDELRASRERMVRAEDDERRSLERDLHDGPQQDLIALAVNLQLARDLLERDPDAAAELLDDMGRDVQRAIEKTARLAQRIYPPLLETGGLGAALRAAAVATGVRTEIGPAVAQLPPADRGNRLLLLARRARGNARRCGWRPSPSPPTTAPRRSRSEGPRRCFPTRCLNGCAIASKPSAAGSRSSRHPMGGRPWAGSRSPDDLRRSQPGRGSRP